MQRVGELRTHWLTGCSGKTSSTSNAAAMGLAALAQETLLQPSIAQELVKFAAHIIRHCREHMRAAHAQIQLKVP